MSVSFLVPFPNCPGKQSTFLWRALLTKIFHWCVCSSESLFIRSNCQLCHNLIDKFHFYQKAPGIFRVSFISASMAIYGSVSSTRHRIHMSSSRFSIIVWRRGCRGWGRSRLRFKSGSICLPRPRVWTQNSSSSFRRGSSFRRWSCKWNHDPKYYLRPPLLPSGGMWTWRCVSGSAWEEVKILQTRIKTLFIVQLFLDQWMCSYRKGSLGHN